MRKLQEEMQAAINERDEETRRELEEEHRKLRERMAKVQNDSEKLASDYNRDKERLEQMIEEAKQHAERAEMEYQKQIQDLRAKLQLANDVYAPEEEANIRQQLVELKKAHDEQQKGFFGYIGDLVRSLFGW
jgi:chromosome segregation ATPase